MTEKPSGTEPQVRDNFIHDWMVDNVDYVIQTGYSGQDIKLEKALKNQMLLS